MDWGSRCISPATFDAVGRMLGPKLNRGASLRKAT
jgi:hypothetical protein